MSSQSVHCVVTSPPYYGLRDYGVDGQIGLEQTPEAYIERLCSVFDEVYRVLRDDGTLWLNIGDSYAGASSGDTKSGFNARYFGKEYASDKQSATFSLPIKRNDSLPSKNLMMIPARVALALQARGWYLRSEIIWHKPNPMPESVADRPTKSHEMVYLLSKQPRYWYDADAVKEPANEDDKRVRTFRNGDRSTMRNDNGAIYVGVDQRNLRDVWTISTQPYSGAHFAVMPPELARKAIKAGCPVGGVVLDPFEGAGTTAIVAIEEGRDYLLCELNPQYAGLALERIKSMRIEIQNRDPFQSRILSDGSKQLSMFAEGLA
jgi:DNA modification methylase